MVINCTGSTQPSSVLPESGLRDRNAASPVACVLCTEPSRNADKLDEEITDAVQWALVYYRAFVNGRVQVGLIVAMRRRCTGETVASFYD